MSGALENDDETGVLVTPEMIAVGADLLENLFPIASPETVAERVFLAMEAAKQSPLASK